MSEDKPCGCVTLAGYTALCPNHKLSTDTAEEIKFESATARGYRHTAEEIERLKAEIAHLKRNPFLQVNCDADTVTLTRTDYHELVAQLDNADRTVFLLQQERDLIQTQKARMREAIEKMVNPPLIEPSEREAQLHKEIGRLQQELDEATDVICGEFCQSDRHHSVCPRREDDEDEED